MSSVNIVRPNVAHPVVSRSALAVVGGAAMLLVALAPAVASAQGGEGGEVEDPTAHYAVRFDSIWSAETHPDDFPGSAHFSRLVGGTHGPGVVFWKPGQLASRGIEDMAELGAVQPLENEVAQAIAAGHAESVVRGTNVPLSPGTATAALTVSRDFPRVTLVTMIAPSPDWFVGTRGLSLLENDRWLQRKVVTVWAYDAGTDSGPTFRSPDQDTVPPEPISRIEGYPFDGVPIGTFTFERTDGSDPLPLVLGDGRFEVTAQWTTETGSTGYGIPVPLTSDTGYFWFFKETNVEMVIKVLDACAIADRFWVFAGGLTNTGVEILAHDTEAGVTRPYSNPLGEAFEPIQDTAGFTTCP